MRESRPYGSVRGARGNSRPYRYLLRYMVCYWPIALVRCGRLRATSACDPTAGHHDSRFCPDAEVVRRALLG